MSIEQEPNRIPQQTVPAPAGLSSGERRGPYVDDPRRKSVLWATVLSAMPGLGQVYVGYYREAFKNILVICGVFALNESGAINQIEAPFMFFMAFFWLHNMVDAGRRASLYNQALDGLRPMDLPEDLKQPPRLGSLAGGILLVGAGLVLLSHTMLGFSLEWVGRWWPMGLVAVGAWLIYEDRKGKGMFGGAEQ